MTPLGVGRMSNVCRRPSVGVQRAELYRILVEEVRG